MSEAIKTPQSAAIVTRRDKWLDQISWEDRQVLRAVVRKAGRHYFRDDPTDVQIDQLIEAVGPEVQRKMIKQALDS